MPIEHRFNAVPFFQLQRLQAVQCLAPCPHLMPDRFLWVFRIVLQEEELQRTSPFCIDRFWCSFKYSIDHNPHTLRSSFYFYTRLRITSAIDISVRSSLLRDKKYRGHHPYPTNHYSKNHQSSRNRESWYRRSYTSLL